MTLINSRRLELYLIFKWLIGSSTTYHQNCDKFGQKLYFIHRLLLTCLYIAHKFKLQLLFCVGIYETRSQCHKQLLEKCSYALLSLRYFNWLTQSHDLHQPITALYFSIAQSCQTSFLRAVVVQLSWQSGRFRYQRSVVRIQSLAKNYLY